MTLDIIFSLAMIVNAVMFVTINKRLEELEAHHDRRR